MEGGQCGGPVGDDRFLRGRERDLALADRHTIPEPRDQRANRRRRGSSGGRPTGFDKERYKKRNVVERAINRLKNHRAVGEVDSGRPADVSIGGFPRAASRTRRARLRAPGSPQIPFQGCSVLHAVMGHGVGMSVPRYRYLVVLTFAGLNSSASSVAGHQPPP